MTGPGAHEKAVVFLSHAVTDAPIARVIHDEIRRVFADGVTVYASSVPGAVRPGEDWLESIRTNLSAAEGVIVVIAPFRSIVHGSASRSGHHGPVAG